MRKSTVATVTSLALVTGGFGLAVASPAGASKGVSSQVSISKSASSQTQREKPRVTLTAKVKPRDGRRARGHVNFKAGGKRVAKAAVHGGVARVTLPRTTEPGRYKIRAVFVPKAGSGLATARSPKAGRKVAVATFPGDRKWDKLAKCESGGNWKTATGNGYYGGLQFSKSTWRAVGGDGLPHQASRLKQIDMGKKLKKRAGAGQWPVCGKVL
ncbi:transglycosylase family protein [Solicola sp. PLA-1-18]|uniref:transglycosylase family protein n=1 Tax=Solicola sp. PLA-1-18 TaxID=3380532 RepID=UPI003B81D5CC